MRRLLALSVLFMLGVAMTACAKEVATTTTRTTTSPGAPGATPSAAATSAHADLIDGDGRSVGTVQFSSERGAVVVAVTASGLSPGFHGFHVHAVGKCEAPFTSAGGHMSSPDKKHPEHAGDQPSLLVNPDGTADESFVTDRYSLADLADSDGSAVIVHAGADNYANIPTRYAPQVDMTTTATGDSGSRIACGVVKPSAAPTPSASPAGPADASANVGLADSGAPAGMVSFTRSGDKTIVAATVNGLPPGFHGFHVHAVGACQPPFASAGPHYKSNADQTHAGHDGDQPSLLVNGDGTAMLRFATTRYDATSLADADGSAVIVHADADNFANIPARYGTADMTTTATGDSGARIACGVVTKAG